MTPKCCLYTPEVPVRKTLEQPVATGSPPTPRVPRPDLPGSSQRPAHRAGEAGRPRSPSPNATGHRGDSAAARLRPGSRPDPRLLPRRTEAGGPRPAHLPGPRA